MSRPVEPPPATGCPLCGKPRAERFAPFCSVRCADLDLGRWLNGGYAIPGSATETEAPPDSPDELPETE